MLSSKMKTLSLVCNTSNKLADGRYKIPMGALAGESVIGCSVKKVVYSNQFYNVVGSGPLKNNTLHGSFDLSPFIITIPEGFYTISQLRPLVETAFQAELNTLAPSPTVTMTYSGITGKISTGVLNNGSTVVIGLKGKDFPDSLNLSLGNTLNIGFNADGTPITFENIIDIRGEDSAGLVIDEIGKGSGLSNSSTSSFGSTSGLLTTLSYEGAGFGSLATYINPNLLDTMLLYDSPQNLSSLTIYLQTASGIVLDLGVSDLHIELLLYLQ